MASPGSSLPFALSVAITPHGHLVPDQASDAEGSIDAAAGRRIAEALGKGDAALLLRLGGSELATPLPPPLAFLREVGRLYLTRLARLPDVETRRAALALEAPADELAALAASAPPMKGLEYLTGEVLAGLWERLDDLVRRELSAWKGDVASWLTERDPAWNTVGRVVFHLAENRKSDTHPFAFLATYVTRAGENARPVHVPLGRALREHGAARDRDTLLALLGPVQRASEASPLVKRLLDSGELFHPLAWTPEAAYRFLKDAAALDACGVVVRLPDFWSARRSRPEVAVTVGGRSPSALGLDALLDFSVELSLDGQPLTDAERRAVLAATSGLALVRGRWVEVDPERLGAVLASWKEARKAARAGMPFGEALRLLSGVPAGTAPDAAGEARAVTRVVPGPWLKEALGQLRGPAAESASDPGPALRGTLRPYQRAGVRWLHTLARLGLGGCLADDMGLGKTIQVLALLLLLRRERPGEPHLLVLPASLLANWKAELDRFAPDLVPLVAHGSAMPPAELAALSPERIAGVDVVLTTYGSLTRLAWLEKVPWGLVVLDEAQAIKNPGTRQARAAKALPGRLRLALTGTPVENRLGDLWSLFDFLAPGLLGSAQAFGRFVKSLAERDPPDYGPLRSVVRPFVLRRMKTDRSVISDLPEKTEVKAFCPLTKAQATLYQEAVDELAGALRGVDGMKRRGVVLAFLMRLKQLCNHPSQWLGDGAYRPEASGKFGRLGELGAELAETQEKALVFTQFRELTGPLADHLATVYGRPGLVLHGGTPVGKRRGLVEEFQRDGGPPFFVLSLKAGGTGLNLTEASHVVHFDRWWNPAVEDQATDRAFRIGQKRNVLVHKLVCRGTVEERIDALIEGKRALSREVLSEGAEVLLTEMSDAELMRLVSLDRATALAE